MFSKLCFLLSVWCQVSTIDTVATIGIIHDKPIILYMYTICLRQLYSYFDMFGMSVRLHDNNLVWYLE